MTNYFYISNVNFLWNVLNISIWFDEYHNEGIFTIVTLLCVRCRETNGVLFLFNEAIIMWFVVLRHFSPICVCLVTSQHRIVFTNYIIVGISIVIKLLLYLMHPRQQHYSALTTFWFSFYYPFMVKILCWKWVSI